MSLKDRVAIVTGASRGIGATLAEELGKRGAKVVCAARGSRAAPPSHGLGTVEDTAERIRAAGGEAIGISADMGNEAQIVRMVEEAVRHFGRLDILVNNAAVTMNPTDLFSDLSGMDYEMSVNFRGPLVAMRHAVPHMRKAGEGRILNVSSAVALNILNPLMIYGVSKLALERLTMDVAEQIKASRIACNVFRIDMPFHNSITDGLDIMRDVDDYIEPELTAAEGMIWMLEQPVEYTGRLEGAYALRRREGIMPQRAKKPFTPECLPFDMSKLRMTW